MNRAHVLVLTDLSMELDEIQCEHNLFIDFILIFCSDAPFGHGQYYHGQDIKE